MMRKYLYEYRASRCKHENESFEFESFVAEIAREVATSYTIAERVLLLEMELKDRQYYCPGNYLEWMAYDVSKETEINEELVYSILIEESDLIDKDF